MAATVQELLNELDSIMVGVQVANALAVSLKAQIADLRAQLDHSLGTVVVTQAQLDAMDAKADAIIAAQAGATAGPDPSNPPQDEV